MSVDLTTIASAVSTDLGAIAKAATSALNPFSSVAGAVQSTAQAVTEVTKSNEQQTNLHNTPAMQANVSAEREAKEVSEDNHAEEKAKQGDQDELLRRLS